MIQKIRSSRTFKGACVFMAFNILAQIVSPLQALALTGGAAQPESGSFTPIGTSDMVNLSSGDMNYNIPLMDVGGYPLNIAYSSGVSMDQEAAWSGLGWNISVGQINNNVRGLPDEFRGDKGDMMTYDDHLKRNITVGGSFKLTPNVFGVDADGNKLGPLPTDVQGVGSDVINADNAGSNNDAAGPVSFGLTASYNNYTGFELKPSVGTGQNSNVGFNIESGPDGLSISPQISFGVKSEKLKKRNIDLGGKVGCSFNARQGLSSLSLSMNKKSQVAYKNKENEDVTKTKNRSVGGTIGFTDELYTPTVRNGMVTGSFSINVALGSEFFGGEAQGQITAFGTIQELATEHRTLGAYGYSNTELANSGKNDRSVLDFNREKDGAVSKNTTHLPLTNYTYDIHSVQGQGVSGMYRPYRNQVGYVFDTYANDISTSANIGLEFGVGNAAHFGWDVGATVVWGHSGVWDANVVNRFKTAVNTAPDYERVHYKNVGDLSVDQDFTADEASSPQNQLFNRIGGYDPVHIPFVGGKFFRSLITKYAFTETADNTSLSINSTIHRSKRQVRNQAITNITNDELREGVGYGPLVGTTPDGVTRKGHHIGEVQITRNDGARYIYGLPAYNKVKKEVTFSIKGTPDCNKGLIGYEEYVNKINNGEYNKLPYDQYFNRTTTPGYVHTHLLTSVLSTDYQDVDGDGPSANDLGSYTKFSYHKNPAYVASTISSTETPYNWRVPLERNMASYNEGLKTDVTDDQGNYVYGVKDMYYIDKIETKTHIAIFHISPRKDAKGVIDEDGGIASQQNSFKLDKISLYSIADYYNSNGTINSNAVPIKEAHFVYSYDLCKGVLNNVKNSSSDPTSYPTENEISNNGGKLTLKRIFFTYKKSKMGKYTDYEFDYNEAIATENPDYNLKGYDSWGNYKNNSGACANSSLITAMEYPYALQDKGEQDINAAVWSLKKINLPSGGTIEIEYESDDYQYVQDKKAMRMYKVAGIGSSQDGTAHIDENAKSDVLFSVGVLPSHKRYLYVEVPEKAVNSSKFSNQNYIKSKYYSGLEKGLMQFRFFVNMTKFGADATSDDDLNEAKFDYVSGYAEIDLDENAQEPHYSQIFEVGGKYYLSIPVKKVEKEGGLIQTPLKDRNPISKAAWQFGRKYLNQHVYSTSDNGDAIIDSPEGVIEDIVEDLFSTRILNNLFEIFAGPNGLLETKGIGRRFIKDKSFVRLDERTGSKLGGGCRVKTVKMKDVWEKMNDEDEGEAGGYQTMNYGQSYSYTLDDRGDEGFEKKSSGVAAYEPVGNKENPFVQPVFSTTKHLLAPDDDNYMEKPFGESFFPSPQVTYSKVKVANLAGGEANFPAGTRVKKLHQTGCVVTEFYTSKDYPTLVDETVIQAKNDDTGVLGSLLKVFSQKHFTGSQGYTVHINDMDGKEKSQRVYAAGQDEFISGVDYLYDGYASNGGISANVSNGNRGRLNNKVTVIYPDGTIKKNTIGVEYDIVNDFRENQTHTIMGGAALNTAGFFLGPIPGFVPMILPKFSNSKEQFRSVSTTKVINTFGILKETIAHDAGASVSTRNLAWDAMTGEVLLTQTVDEYNDQYYTFNYPAHWMYKGMGAASQNLGFVGRLGSYVSGTYPLLNLASSNSPIASDYLIDGDEIAIVSGSTLVKGWVVNVQGDLFKVIDADGNELTGYSGLPFKVMRSGHRNLQSAGIMNITLMHNPLLNVTNQLPLSSLNNSFLSTALWDNYKIINAGAVDYSDNWVGNCECHAANSTGVSNPYLTNEKGVWRTKSSRTYLTGRNSQTLTTGRREGFFTSFSPFYKLSAGGNWYKDYNNWTFVAEVSIFSPYGFELENKDALNRYSGAQYGYNNKFPMAVGANTKYAEIGFDGFEDYGFDGCNLNSHFSFKDIIGDNAQPTIAHTGNHSIKVNAGSTITLNKKLKCPEAN